MPFFRHRTLAACAPLYGALLLALAFLLPAPSAQAKPEFARKERKACQYCHISPTPNAVAPRTNARQPTLRNRRGAYYASHNHTFAGYNELAVMGKNSPPVFHLEWKEELLDTPRRMASADVAGDGKSRLVTLNEVAGRKDAATLTVKRWDGKTFVVDFTGEVKAPADKLAVGKFAGANQPAVIVTGDALWRWNGTTFARKPAPRSLTILGATRLKSGEERVLIAESAQDVKAYRVEPSAEGSGWLIDPIPAPGASQVQWGDMKESAEFFTQLGFVDQIARGGLIGLWDARKFGTLFLYYAKIDQDIDSQPDPKDPKKTIFTIKSQSHYLTTINPGDPQSLDVWESPKLDGPTFDVAVADPKGSGLPGLLILSGSSASGQGRSLTFFALD